MIDIDPLSLLSIAIIQIGSKHLNIELTEYQKKMLRRPEIQFVILFSIVYVSTKSIKNAIFVSILIYVFIYIIFNDNHELSIIIKDTNVKESYEKGIKELHDEEKN